MSAGVMAAQASTASFTDGGAPQGIAVPAPVRLPTDQPPLLLVLVDAEEEFDWSAGFHRANTGVSAIDAIERGQDVFDPFGIKPIYVVDYPVAAAPAAAARIGALARDDRAEIGAHQHPWVCPPHDEQVGDQLSFPGNLPAELEAAKLDRLTQAIEAGTGVRPRIYQAGRYGIGPNTARILADQGYTVDCSASPPFDYAPEGGPDYSAWAPEPYWFGARRDMLGLPCTGAYVGTAGGRSHGLHAWATRPGPRRLRAPGILARLGVVERLRLSPEGFALGDMQRLTDVLLARGVRVFLMSYHAPSLKPGCTEYVRDADELAAFLQRMRDYCRWFFEQRGGGTTTTEGLATLLAAGGAAGGTAA